MDKVSYIQFYQEANLKMYSYDTNLVAAQFEKDWSTPDEDELKAIYKQSTDNVESVLSTYKSLLTRYKKENKSIYQQPSTYIILRGIEQGIRDSAMELNYDLPFEPQIGSIISPQVNAVINYDHQVILFNNGLIRYFGILFKTIFALLKWGPESKDSDNLMALPDQDFAFQKIVKKPQILDALNQQLERSISLELVFDINKDNDLEEFWEKHMHYHFARIRKTAGHL